MAILGASFQIGRSALAAYQAALTVTGQNIANVGNPNYTRLTGYLTAMPGGMTLSGISPGTGVNLDRLLRHFDSAVEARLRYSLGDRSAAQASHQTLSRIESLYNELTDYDLSSQLESFFGAFANLQTDPEDTAARNLVLSNADAVVRTIQRQRQGLFQETQDLNAQIESATRDANSLLGQIAELNEQIVAASSRGGGGDYALRDRRDGLLRDLGQLIQIQTREQDNGVANVYAGSEPLVDGNRARQLVAQRTVVNGVERLNIRFGDTNAPVPLRGGQLTALAQARDTHVVAEIGKLDQLARGLIYEVNRVHAGGTGLDGYTSMTGSVALNSNDAALSSGGSGLPFPIQNGSFLVRVRDANGQTVTRQIQVDLDGLGAADTSLNSLVQDLNSVPGLSATVTADNRVQLTADSGFEFSFAEDSSGALAALGLGTFFQGSDAATLDINSDLRTNPRLLAASLNGEPGDGGNAGRLAAVGSTVSTLLGGLSIQDFQESITNQLSVQTAAAQTAYDAADAVYSSLMAQREVVSGVSLDEEAVNLTMYERAFQGASRYVSVIDSMTTELMNLL